MNKKIINIETSNYNKLVIKIEFRHHISYDKRITKGH